VPIAPNGHLVDGAEDEDEDEDEAEDEAENEDKDKDEDDMSDEFVHGTLSCNKGIVPKADTYFSIALRSS